MASKRRRKLGLSSNEELSYDQLILDQKPQELHREIAQMRALLISYREAAQVAADATGDELVGVVTEYLMNYLIDTKNLSQEKSEKIVELLRPALEDVVEAHVRPMIMPGDYLDNVRGMLKDIAFIAEKMKKIKEGTVFNVNINVETLSEFLSYVVFTNISDFATKKKISNAFQKYLGTPRAQDTIIQSTEESIEGEYDVIS